ncbi:MAG: B12-binding radical protein [Bacilli bacterium]|nr:B12-binding radical protein [Bacilli bacterium]
MRVCLSTLNAKYIHSSLALRYLKAFSEQDFPDICMKEFTIKDVPISIATSIYAAKPDVVGFSCYIWNIEETIPVIRILRKILPDVKIVLGGPEVSYDVKEWMERIPEVDVIVVGEGEQTFHHLLKEFAGRERLHLVPGIALREGERVVISGPRDKVNLGDIPSPYTDAEDLQSLVPRVVYFECSRGCPFSCSYCLSSIESGVRYFPIERIKADLRRLIDAGVKTIKFVDRTFNINRQYALDIFDFLIQNHKGTVFQFEITADILKPEIVDYLSENAPPGLFRFEIGVQSTNDITNSIVKRRQNFAKLSGTVSGIARSGKIAQHLDLIAGLPEEDYASFRNTFNDVFALRPEELQLGFLKMLRGTGVRFEADKYGYVYMDQAPYEILSNQVLSFDDVIRIKRVEDVLEKYWNAHRTDHAILHLIASEFDTAFDFFQEFGDFWETNGWSRIGHQLEDLYIRLYRFLCKRSVRQLQLAKDLLKLDYLSQYSYKPRALWWEERLDKQEVAALFKQVISDPEAFFGTNPPVKTFSEAELHKHCMVEQLSFDVYRYLTNGSLIPLTDQNKELGQLVAYFPAQGEHSKASLFGYHPPKMEHISRQRYEVFPVGKVEYLS